MQTYIIHDRIFLRTSTGIMPFWRMGAIQSRSAHGWSAVHNILDITNDVYHFSDEDGVQYQYRDKILTVEAFNAWVENGIKQARTVEQILAANPGLKDIHCWVTVKDYSWRTKYIEWDAHITSTESLDAWLSAIEITLAELTYEVRVNMQNITYTIEADFGPHKLKC